jgi:hypothetical protein
MNIRVANRRATEDLGWSRSGRKNRLRWVHGGYRFSRNEIYGRGRRANNLM